jgi:hypothetical protein
VISRVLEFYWVDEEGRQEELGRQWQTAKSPEIIEARARATLKNVLFGGRHANLCLVKDGRSGKTLSVLVSSRSK